MPSGPKPKPVELREKQGTLKPGRTPEVVVFDPMSSLPLPPEDLDATGKEAWAVTTEALMAAGALQRHYLPIIRLFAESVSIAAEARKQLEGAALVQKGTSARPGGVNPHFRVWRDAVSAARSLAEQIGASPVAMARLGLAQVKGLSLSEELVARRKERG